MAAFKTIDDRRRHTMRLLSQYVEALPLLPETARIVRATRRDDRELPDKIEALARLDPALAVRMVYIANHTFNFRRDQEVTLAQIMALAGADRIADSIRRLDATEPKETKFFDLAAQQDLWLHSIQVAMASRYFSQHIGVQRPPAEEAYLCGLLHDLGRIIMLVTASENVAELNERHWATGAEPVAAEQDVCGFDHATLGWLACRNWNFPDTLAAVNRYHHSPGGRQDAGFSPRVATMVRIVSLADELSLLMTQDSGFVSRPSSLRVAAMAHGKIGHVAEQLGLSLTVIDQFVSPLDAISRTRLASNQDTSLTTHQAFATTN